jgi:mitochondrial fission protein ELM1
MARCLIWALLGSRAGDNAQVLELAGRLGGEVVSKPLKFNFFHHVPNWLLGASLASLAPEARERIKPPWPDLVIAAGKRTVPVALGIKRASGGRSKLVHLGRPRAALEHFDLVLSTPQYGLPERPNVIEMELPFAVAKPVGEVELAKWRRAWRDLPRPLTVLIVGAGKFPFTMDEAGLRRLGQLSSAEAKDGSLLIVMSPRSGAEAHRIIEREVQVPHFCYPFTPRGDNPFQAALALADQFIVTSDSISMISEALSTGKPVRIFTLAISPFRLTWNGKEGVLGWLSAKGILQPPRNIEAVLRRLLEQGHVSELGGPVAAGKPVQRNDGEVLERIKALLA